MDEKNPYLCRLFYYEAGNLTTDEFRIVGVTPLNSGAIEIDRHIDGGKFEKTMYARGEWQKVQVVGDVKSGAQVPVVGQPANERN